MHHCISSSNNLTKLQIFKTEPEVTCLSHTSIAEQSSPKKERMAELLFLAVLCLISFQLCSCASPWGFMTTGSSIRSEDHEKIFLISPDATFSCGFHQLGRNAFTFSIWYTTNASEKTVVWTANPYSPVNGYSPVNLYGSRISLNHDGNLVLSDTNGSTVWESKTSSGKHTIVSLLNTGNLVINDSSNNIVWQSFHWPTDTLLPWQNLFGDRSTEILLSWSHRYRISLGTARGLAYLHHECLEWVVHCDVKPENILLTRDFDAKIADFGLAKLAKRDSTSFNFTHMRGTMGYMAPEWALNLPINAKVDVYSYGVVILEVVTGIRVSSGVMIDGRQVVFPEFVQQAKQILATGDVTDLVDARLNGHFDPEQAIAMVTVAVSCLEERSKRPTMNEIVKVLMSCDDEEDYHPAYSY